MTPRGARHRRGGVRGRRGQHDRRVGLADHVPDAARLGYSPVVANVSNTVGLVPGGISGAIGYRRELRGQWRRALILALRDRGGAVVGGILLLTLPDACSTPSSRSLILFACGLMAIKRTPAAHRDRATERGDRRRFVTGIYGGYFGAAQGIILMSLLRLLLPGRPAAPERAQERARRRANGVAAILFIAVAEVAWEAAALIAARLDRGRAGRRAYGRRDPRRCCAGSW